MHTKLRCNTCEALINRDELEEPFGLSGLEPACPHCQGSDFSDEKDEKDETVNKPNPIKVRINKVRSLVYKLGCDSGKDDIEAMIYCEISDLLGAFTERIRKELNNIDKDYSEKELLIPQNNREYWLFTEARQRFESIIKELENIK